MYADSGIGMVDGVFMVDGPSINHGQKAINNKSWLMFEGMVDGGPEYGPGYGLSI